MNKNSKAHSAPGSKHQFDDKKKREIIEWICDVMGKNGIPKGAEILMDTLLKSEEEEQDKHRKKKSILIVFSVCVGAGIFLTCFFEWLGRALNLGDIWSEILQYVPVFAESILIFISAIFKIIRMPDSTRVRQEGEGLAEGMIEWVKDLGHQLSRASGLHILSLLLATTLGSTMIARSEPMKHIEVFFSGGMYALVHYDDNNNITESVMMADGGAEKISASYEIKQYLTDADEIMIEQLDKAKVTNEQKNMELQLSDEDEYSIFTCWGNGLDGYGTQEQLNSRVLSTVKGWCGEQRDNVFDREPEQGGAPQEDKDAISRASKSEQPDDSFSDVEDRLDCREGIVKDYPKRTLMQLVANGYQGLALRLVWHEGVQATIIYYYGQSILFDFECLKFADSTDKVIKERLTIIAQRYEDIAYVCPNYERAEDAGKLAAAFRYAANQY